MGSPPASGLASGSAPVLDPLFGTDAAPPGNDRQAQTVFIKRLRSSLPSHIRENLDHRSFKTYRPLLPHAQTACNMHPNGRAACLDVMRLTLVVSSILIYEGKEKNAEDLLRRVISLSEALGVEDGEALNTIHMIRLCLATLYIDRDRCEEAEEHLVLALEQIKSRHGSNHPTAFPIMGQLSVVCFRLGQVGRAWKYVSMLQNGFWLLCERGGPDQAIRSCLTSMTTALLMHGQYEVVADFYDEILKRGLSITDPANDEVFYNAIELTRCNLLCDRVAKAESLVGQFLEIHGRENEDGSLNLYGAMLHRFLAVIHLKIGRVQKAVEEYRQVITGLGEGVNLFKHHCLVEMVMLLGALSQDEVVAALKELLTQFREREGSRDLAGYLEALKVVEKWKAGSISISRTSVALEEFIEWVLQRDMF